MALRRFLRGWANVPFLPEGMRPQIPQLIEAQNPAAPATLPPDQWRGTPGERRVLVVGGGLAGLSASLELAERGYKVRLVEKEPYLGGRLHEREEQTPEGRFKVEHGLHMWFDNYFVCKDIRNRLGVNANFKPYEAVHFAFRDYKPEKLASKPQVYPLNLVNLVLQSPNLSLLDALEQFRGLSEVMYYDHDEIHRKYDKITFREWAEQKGISKKFYELILQPAASVTLNDPDKVSAAEMIQFMHTYFLSRASAMNREITTTDHGTALIEPWEDRLRSLGVEIETGRGVEGLRFVDGKAVGEVGRDEDYEHVVIATSVPGTKRILAGSDADAA
ncbi:MAG: FAD-dependent oxidoreductase, partial [Myxococcota bacterium]